jgi:hypothetical protein
VLGFLNHNVYALGADVPQEVSSEEENSEKEKVRSIFENNGTMLELIQAVGKDVAFLFGEENDNPDRGRSTILHEAANSTSLGVLLFLLSTHNKLGSLFSKIINRKNSEGDTPLHTWCYFLLGGDFPSDDDLDAIRMLIDCGANPFRKNSKGQTPRQALEEWVREEKELPEDERSINSAEKLEVCRKGIEILEAAEDARLEDHPSEEEEEDEVEKADEAKSESTVA